MSTRTLAAALSITTERRMVAPSFVTETDWSCSETRWRILSIPLGPRVVLAMSAMAIAPTKEERRAFSPFLVLWWWWLFVVGVVWEGYYCWAEK